MTKTHEEYMTRIANATPLQLTIILYELAIGFIDGAMAAQARSAELKTAISKARGAVEELFASLDMDVPTAEELANLLLYVNRLLIQSNVQRDEHKKNLLLADARKIMFELHNAWQQLETTDALAEKIFENAPQVFAGLTYSKDGQLAEFIEDNPDRGYKI